MKLLRLIVNSGVRFALTAADRRGILLTNATGLILFVLSAVTGVIYYLWYGWSFVTGTIPVIGLLALVVIPLNFYGYATLSRVWLSIVIPAVVTAMSIESKRLYYDQQEELDYFTFRIVVLGSCVIPWMLFSLKERTALALSALGGLAILLLHDPIHWGFGVPYQKDKMKVMNYYFTNIVIFITYCTLVASLAFLKWLSEKNEVRNIELIDDLNRVNQLLVDRNAEIEAQNTEIHAQSDVLQANQEQLIEANRLIEEQRKRLFNKNQALESELVEKNQDLVETNAELVKHNNELRQFSYTVSHNLRGPVASLLGLLGLIDPQRLPPEDVEIFHHIKASTLRLDDIIKELSKIIDIRHDIFQIRQKIHFRDELRSIQKTLEREINAHQAIVRTDVDSCPVLYSVRPMVHSILYNLVSNSIKYRSTDRVPVIEVSTREHNDHVIIQVRDNGLGIDLKSHKENVFKLYKRFHPHTEGKGLGLYLVKLQCEALGGEIDVQSEVNKFTEFTVRLRKPENVQRQMLMNEPYAKIFFDATVNATGVVWYGPISGDQYRRVFTKALEFLRAYNTPNWVSDILHQGPIDEADQRWMFTNIIPEAAKNGLRRIASIRSDATDPKIVTYLEGIQTNLEKFNIQYRSFISFEEAFDWMMLENEKATLQS